MPTSAAAFARERTVALDMFASFGIVWEKVIKLFVVKMKEQFYVLNSFRFDRVLFSEL